MQKQRAYLIYLLFALLAFACEKESDKVGPKFYAPNETIFNTFLYAEGSWWAYEDSFGKQDTFSVISHSALHRNVFEGSTHVYSDYDYQGTLMRSKEEKKFNILYNSHLQHEYLGAIRTFLKITSFQNLSGYGTEHLFYTPWPLNDSILVGSKPEPYSKLSYLTIIESGDSLFYTGEWHKGKFYKLRISNSVTNNFNDVSYTWQENIGLVNYNVDGADYQLIDYNISKPIK